MDGDEIDDDGLAEVIKLPTSYGANSYNAKLDDLPVRTTTWTAKACRHSRSTVDKDARIIVCRDCEAQLDPITVLHQLAQRHEAIVTQGAMAERHVKDLREEIAKLTRQETNAKSRIRTARKRRVEGEDAAIEAAARALFEAATAVPWETVAPDRKKMLIDRAVATIDGYFGALDIGRADQGESAA